MTRQAVTLLTGAIFCAFPVHSNHYGITRGDCLELCTMTAACYHFNFRLTARTTGQCVLVAPHSGQQPIVPEKDADGWNFMTVLA